MSNKYTMTLSLNVLKHLGLNLYSNIAAVLSEVVANSYDADSEVVNIQFEQGKVIITDDGHGMTLSDINNKYLCVGYSKRENNESQSLRFKRNVMGRKGIGKLSLFSIAREVKIYTRRENSFGSYEENALLLSIDDIENEIQNSGVYHPKDIEYHDIGHNTGTRIVLTSFKKKSISHTPSYLRRRIARRFSVLGPKYNFDVQINEKSISSEDRDYFKKILFLWTIGNQDDEIFKKFSFKKKEVLNGVIDGHGYEISGWIGAVDKPRDLDQDGTKNNNISVYCRGKMAQEDILHTYNEGGVYATYLIGEIHADFLDSDQDEDIATSSRQKINEDDPRYNILLGHVYSLLKQIQGVWTKYRKELKEQEAVKNAEYISPTLKIWFDNLGTDSRKEHAKKLFATIESLHFDPNDEVEKKKELYRHGILAFEKLKLKESLNELSKLQTADDLKLASLFTDLTDIEANQYYDIASARVEVIRQFNKHLEANDKERILQEYLFDNLWLLNPSWERPLSGTEIMEQSVHKEFDIVTDNLTEDEKRGRLDVKYRTTAGTHIIIELKRYSTTYKVTLGSLIDQVNKYKNALAKCLKTAGDDNQNIQMFIILGDTLAGVEFEQAELALKSLNTRILRYDYLINESLKSYSDYLDRQKEVSRIRQLVEQI